MRSNRSRIFLLGAALALLCSPVLAGSNSDRWYDFLRDVYDRHDKDLREFLLSQLELYDRIDPDGQYADDVLYMRAKVYEEEKDTDEELACYVKLIYLFPESEHRDPCLDGARRIVNTAKSYKKRADEILPRIEGPPLLDSREDRRFAYLEFLYELEEKDLMRWAVREADDFLLLHPGDKRAPRVAQWIGDLYVGLGQDEEAEASYLKSERLYPDYVLLSYARFQRGKLMVDELDRTEEGLQLFESVMEEYPDSEQARAAAFARAEAKAEKLKDYNGAVDDFRAFVDAYPEDEHAVDALLRMGEIRADKLDYYLPAVEAYVEVADRYPQDRRGYEALERAGDLYRRRLKDPAKAAEMYARAGESYPDEEKAPALVFEAGDLVEDALEDYALAITYYEKVRELFPDHKLALEALKRIDRAQRKQVREE